MMHCLSVSIVRIIVSFFIPFYNFGRTTKKNKSPKEYKNRTEKTALFTSKYRLEDIALSYEESEDILIHQLNLKKKAFQILNACSQIKHLGLS